MRFAYLTEEGLQAINQQLFEDMDESEIEVLSYIRERYRAKPRRQVSTTVIAANLEMDQADAVDYVLSLEQRGFVTTSGQTLRR